MAARRRAGPSILPILPELLLTQAAQGALQRDEMLRPAVSYDAAQPVMGWLGCSLAYPTGSVARFGLRGGTAPGSGFIGFPGMWWDYTGPQGVLTRWQTFARRPLCRSGCDRQCLYGSSKNAARPGKFARRNAAEWY